MNKIKDLTETLQAKRVQEILKTDPQFQKILEMDLSQYKGLQYLSTTTLQVEVEILRRMVYELCVSISDLRGTPMGPEDKAKLAERLHGSPELVLQALRQKPGR